MSPPKRKITVRRPRSLFVTKTFKIGLISYLSGLFPVLLDCFYSQSLPNIEQSNTIVALSITFAFLLVGRTTNDPVYTPPQIPGANKQDYE